MVINVF